MPRYSSRQPSTPAITPHYDRAEQRSHKPFRVLVVDRGMDLAKQLERCMDTQQPIKVEHACNLGEARERLARRPIDLVVADTTLPDGSGFDLARTLRQRRRRTQMLMVTDTPTVEAAVQAMRLGAVDFLTRPLETKQLTQRVREVIARQDHDHHQTQRIRRLRRACHKLNEAREEISQQVDILCSDLVSAYQELADQMQQNVSSTEYQAMVRQELDLEQLLLKTLEYLIDRAGPTNAALFLPSTADEFSLGGYVNFDCSSDAADLLLQHLGDVFAPRVAEHAKVLRLNSDKVLQEHMGDDAAYLAECDVLAFACQHENEALAVITLFRDRDDPFDDQLVDICASIAPIMAEALSRLIRIHHRSNLFDDEYGDERSDEFGGELA
ncbi:response regulator [Phycisphaerales bacterium AB-hyl4]|uniref:Response regulator n=1 Tax=Natronomicrosphaera hydrolytica TaxID=3242702 RepID=A0ABV4U9C9_9BACT